MNRQKQTRDWSKANVINVFIVHALFHATLSYFHSYSLLIAIERRSLSHISVKQFQKDTTDHISKRFSFSYLMIWMWYSPDIFFSRDIHRHLSSVMRLSNKI